MIKVRLVWVALLSLYLLPIAQADTYTIGQPVQEDFKSFAGQFLTNNCVDCHGDTDPEGNLSLHDLGPVDEVNAQIWNSIWAQVTLKEMPPKDAEQPEVIARLKFSAWIVGELTRVMQDKGGFHDHLDPNKGNFVDHQLLFGKLPKGLHTGQALSRRVITRDFRILSGVRKTLTSQFNYLGELCAFINWYRQIRLGVIAQNSETRKLYEAALRMLLLNYEERVKQIQHYFGLIEQSLVLIEQQKGQTREYENQQLILSCWPKLEEAFEINKTRDFLAPEDLTSELLESVQTTNRDYTEMIRAMSPKSVSSGLSWMEECREKGGRTLSEILAP